MIVSEYNRGYLNKDQLQRKYHIGGNSCILNWLRKYSTFIPPTHSIGRPMKDADKQRIKELEALLKKKQQERPSFLLLMLQRYAN
jgi:transposase